MKFEISKFNFYIGVITILFILTSSSALATSGACSNHKGVNCGAGPDYDGSVVCNDGWRDSTVLYANNKECTNACVALANLVALNEQKQRVNNGKTEDAATLPDVCKKYSMSLSQAISVGRVFENDCKSGGNISCAAVMGDRYRYALALYSENKKLAEKCVYDFYYSATLLACYKKSEAPKSDLADSSGGTKNTDKIIAKQNVNVRSQPSTRAKIQWVARKNDRYTILAMENGWYKITNKDGKIGWTIGKYYSQSE